MSKLESSISNGCGSESCCGKVVSHRQQNAAAIGHLLIGHGTRSAKGTEEFFALAEVLREHVAPAPFRACLLELQEPTIDQAWDDLIEEGVRGINAMPLLLFAAGHARRDIPEALTACCLRSREAGSDVCFLQTSALESHPKLLQLSQLRYDQSIEGHASYDRSRTALVMVGRGSLDHSATAEMYRFSERRGQQSRPAVLRTGFVAMAEPKLPSVLEEVGTAEEIDTVVVQPHLLFEGDLNQRIGDMAREAAQKFPDRKWIVTERLGPHSILAEALADRTSCSGTSSPSC